MVLRDGSGPLPPSPVNRPGDWLSPLTLKLGGLRAPGKKVSYKESASALHTQSRPGQWGPLSTLAPSPSHQEGQAPLEGGPPSPTCGPGASLLLLPFLFLDALLCQHHADHPGPQSCRWRNLPDGRGTRTLTRLHPPAPRVSGPNNSKDGGPITPSSNPAGFTSSPEPVRDLAGWGQTRARPRAVQGAEGRIHGQWLSQACRGLGADQRR